VSEETDEHMSNEMMRWSRMYWHRVCGKQYGYRIQKII